MKHPHRLPAILCLAASLMTSLALAAPRNLVFILADDLGYGEPVCWAINRY